MIQNASSGIPLELAGRRRRGIQGTSSGVAAQSAFSVQVLADSPVAYYQFKETNGTSAADSAGANTGTYTGGVTLNQAGAVTGGRSILLDGTSGYVNVPDAAALRLTSTFTLEAWVNPTDLTNFWFIVTKDNASAPGAYEFRIEQTTGKPNLLAGSTLTATAAVTAASWNHVAFTLGAGTGTHYLNGAANGTGAVTAGIDSGHAVKLGARDDLTIFFKGSIAEVALYNTALSGARILAHWNAR